MTEKRAYIQRAKSQQQFWKSSYVQMLKLRWKEGDQKSTGSPAAWVLKDPPEISFILCPELAAILDKSQSLVGEEGQSNVKYLDSNDF